MNPDALSEGSVIYHQSETEKPEAEHSGNRIERVRDVCKKLRTGSVLRILALENQNLVERQIGREEGRGESRLAIVRNLIYRGDTDETILHIVECSREYIANVRKDM